jgi:DNA polymerase-3 subunit beta
MKIETTLEKIKDAVSRIQKISAKNLSLPILENVLITVKDNVLVLRSTNLHVGTEITVPVKVEREGEISVKIDVFGSIINSLDGEHKVVLELVENTLRITTNKSEMSIKLFSHNDFPTLPRVEDGVEVIIPVEILIEGVRSVVYSASQSDIKPEISSVYIYTENNELVFVATDSFRLAEKRIVTNATSDFPGIIVPVKNIQECVKIFTGVEGNITLSIGKNQLSINSDDIYFTSRIVDGNYPDYKQIIPSESKTDVVVLKDELIKSLRLVNVFSDNFNQIFVKTNKEKGLIDIHSRNTDVGENNTSVDAAITGEGIEMYLNHKYLTDVLSAIHTDSINFSFTEKNRPCIMRAIGDPSFLYLIMPMNR